jgi:flagellar motor switch protein FliM
MSEYLTQKAIDEYLAGETALKAIPEKQDLRQYSFRRPPRISRDRLVALDMILSRFAQSLQSVLVFRLHHPVKVSIITIEQVIFSEFLLSLPSPCSAFEFRLRPDSQEHGVIDLGTPLSLYCVDRMLGGTGGEPPAERRLTRLEQGIARKVAGYVVTQLAEALAEWSKLSPELAAFESNPEAIGGMHPEEHILAFILEVRADEFAAQLTIGLPLDTLEEVTGRPEAHGGDRAVEGPTKEQELLEQGIRQTRVDVAVRLPLLHLGARALAELAPGDVIDTGHRDDVLYEVQLNGKPTYVGSLGQVRRQLGLRITEPVTEAKQARWDLGKAGRVLWAATRETRGEPETNGGRGAQEGMEAAVNQVERPATAGAPLMELRAGEAPAPAGSLGALLDVPMPVVIEIGRTTMTVDELLKLGVGSVIELDRMVEEPVDVFVSDRRLAQGQIVVVGERFAVRLTRVLSTVPGAGKDS